MTGIISNTEALVTSAAASHPSKGSCFEEKLYSHSLTFLSQLPSTVYPVKNSFRTPERTLTSIALLDLTDKE